MFGIQLIEHPLLRPVPKIQVSPLFKWCSDECRAEMNAYLLETFGTQEVVYVMPATGAMFISPKTMGVIRGLTP